MAVKTAICIICNKSIPKDRVSALKMLGKDIREWTHVGCSQETKNQGIYTGESGTSKLLIVRKVYNDSVRDVFKKSSEDTEEDTSEE